MSTSGAEMVSASCVCPVVKQTAPYMSSVLSNIDTRFVYTLCTHVTADESVQRGNLNALCASRSAL